MKDTKACARCGAAHPLSRYRPDKRTVDGRSKRCESCIAPRPWGTRAADPKAYVYEWHAQPDVQQRARDRARRRYHEDAAYRAAAIRNAVSWAKRYPHKKRAHAAVKHAKQSGKLIQPGACSKCAILTSTLHGHHPNYDRPLVVQWLCAACHHGHHADARHQARRSQRQPEPV